MFFVLKQVQENGRTYDVNVRVGGVRTVKGAKNMAKRHAPAIVRDESRRIVGQTVNPAIPNYFL